MTPNVTCASASIARSKRLAYGLLSLRYDTARVGASPSPRLVKRAFTLIASGYLLQLPEAPFALSLTTMICVLWDHFVTMGHARRHLERLASACFVARVRRIDRPGER